MTAGDGSELGLKLLEGAVKGVFRYLIAVHQRGSGLASAAGGKHAAVFQEAEVGIDIDGAFFHDELQ